MPRYLRVGIKIGGGFFATIITGIAIVIVSISALRTVSHNKDILVFDYAQDFIDVEKLRTIAEENVASGRGYLITGDPNYLKRMEMGKNLFIERLEEIKRKNVLTHEVALIQEIEESERQYDDALRRLIDLKRTKTSPWVMAVQFETGVQPYRDRFQKAIVSYSRHCQQVLDQMKEDSLKTTARSIRLVTLISVIALFLVLIIAFVLTRILVKLYHELELAVRAREEIVEVVSHDLKNPLAAVELSTSLLMKSEENGEIKNKLRRILSATGRMKELVYGLLDLSKLRTGRFDVNLRPCLPYEVLSEAKDVLEPLASQKEISLDISSSKDLPPLYCDRERILQVLSNLIGNAVKFTPQGGKIKINAQPENGHVVFSVADTGSGIPEEQLPYIFERYWQSSNARNQGSGLGLAISKGIINAHGGKIWAESSPEGSLFHFTVPTYSHP